MAKKIKFPEYDTHPAALALPELPDEEFAALMEDIGAHGQRIPIELTHDNRILDGRHRYRACRKLGVLPKVHKLAKSVDPIAYVISANVRRRHLTVGQRAAIGSELSKLSPGNPQFSAGIPNSPPAANSDSATQSSIAESLGIAPQRIREYRQVREADADLAKEVAAGDVPLTRAVKEVREDKKKPAQLADRHGDLVPKSLYPLFDDVPILRAMIEKIHAVRRDVEERCRDKQPIMAFVHRQSVVADLKNASDALNIALPYCVCPVCGGDKCDHCRRQGYVNKMTYDIIPKGMKRGADR